MSKAFAQKGARRVYAVFEPPVTSHPIGGLFISTQMNWGSPVLIPKTQTAAPAAHRFWQRLQQRLKCQHAHWHLEDCYMEELHGYYDERIGEREVQVRRCLVCGKQRKTKGPLRDED
jgi:hypothetical protein